MERVVTQVVYVTDHNTYLCGINEFLNDVCPSEGRVLLEYAADHPYGEPIEELDAFFNSWCILRRLSSMSIHAELLNLLPWTQRQAGEYDSRYMYTLDLTRQIHVHY